MYSWLKYLFYILTEFGANEIIRSWNSNLENVFLKTIYFAKIGEITFWK